MPNVVALEFSLGLEATFGRSHLGPDSVLSQSQTRRTWDFISRPQLWGYHETALLISVLGVCMCVGLLQE